MRLYNPWPEPYQINARSPYGPRRDPITGRPGTMHHGIDVAMPIGTPLIAGAPGVVAHKGSGASGGFTLLIRHEGNWHSVYYHLQAPSHLNVGEQVNPGQVVARSGNTGRSTGPHLHFELRRSRQFGNTVDPVPHLIGPWRPDNVPGEQPVSPVRPSRPARPTRPTRVPPMVTGVANMFRHPAQYLRGRGIW
jgi:murein DD-endopeptidase MepM/ murein hydrolase activator NlpD